MLTHGPGHEALERWRNELELIRAFAPNDPMSAWARARELTAEIEAAIPRPRRHEASDLEQLLARARRATRTYGDHAARWQADAAAREQHFHRIELEHSSGQGSWARTG